MLVRHMASVFVNYAEIFLLLLFNNEQFGLRFWSRQVRLNLDIQIVHIGLQYLKWC
jgi:hypothetical protein